MTSKPCKLSPRLSLSLQVSALLSSVPEFCVMLLLSYSISTLQYFRLRTYDSCRSDVHYILLIRPTQELQKFCIRPTKVVLPTYKSCASDLLLLCIRPTKVVYLTYKYSATDLHKFCIQPTIKYATSLPTFVQCFRYTVHRTNTS